MKLESLVQYLDGYLGVTGHPDYRTAVNGLQVESGGEIDRVATAVDTTEASIDAAIDANADLMIVHHGLFWDGLRPLTGRHFRRVKKLLDADLALYSCHLPLDGHPEIGNAALLAAALHVTVSEGFGEYESVSIGCQGTLEEPVAIDAFVKTIEDTVGPGVTLLRGGPDSIHRVAIVTGGGAGFVEAAAAAGADVLVTGEGSHHHAHDAREYGVHIVLAGHYATETFGVRALGDHLAQRFGLEATFIDLPTGL